MFSKPFPSSIGLYIYHKYQKPVPLLSSCLIKFNINRIFVLHSLLVWFFSIFLVFAFDNFRELVAAAIASTRLLTVETHYSLSILKPFKQLCSKTGFIIAYSFRYQSLASISMDILQVKKLLKEKYEPSRSTCTLWLPILSYLKYIVTILSLNPPFLR